MKRDCTAEGVSDVVGEMMLIAIVLILVALFSASLPAILPVERELSVTIYPQYSPTGVTLWHKGGDFVDVKKNDLALVVVYANPDKQSKKIGWNDPSFDNTGGFDLGGKITVTTPLSDGDEVRLVTKRTVLFLGQV